MQKVSQIHFFKNVTAVKCVNRVVLLETDAVRAVKEGVVSERCKSLRLRPAECLSSIRGGIAQHIVGDQLAVKGFESVSPALIVIHVGNRGFTRAKRRRGRNRIGFLEGNITARVVFPSIRLACSVVILADKSSKRIVGILKEQGIALRNGGKVAKLVIGVLIRARSCLRTVYLAEGDR